MEDNPVTSKINQPPSKYSASFKKAVVKEFEQGLLNKDHTCPIINAQANASATHTLKPRKWNKKPVNFFKD